MAIFALYPITAMTNKEVVAEIKKGNKPYLHINPQMSQTYFSDTSIRIENGLAKPKTVKHFFERFGYIGDWNNFEKA